MPAVNDPRMISLRFGELVMNDPEVQEKIKAAMENYSGEKTEKAVFENVLVPIAKEYDVTATYEEFLEFMKGTVSTKELSPDEMDQVAGGKVTGGGLGIFRCEFYGLGVGAGGGNGAGGACVGLGFGTGVTGCITVGASGAIK